MNNSRIVTASGTLVDHGAGFNARCSRKSLQLSYPLKAECYKFALPFLRSLSAII